MADRDDLVGRVLGGRYRCVAILGRGGQGVVARAVDTQHGQLVALKIRAVGPSVDRESVLEEARLLIAVPPHPNVALVRADFFDGDQHVLVMDLVDGPSVDKLLAEHDGQGLPAPLAIRWLGDIAAALDHLHAQRLPLVHGDVKPANIVIRPDDGNGRAVLVDFGLATTEPTGRLRLATSGFAPPEAATSTQTPAGDMYAFAATACTLLTGAPPEPGGSNELAAPVRNALRRGLALQPSDRPNSARRFVADLAASAGVAAVTPVAPPSARRPARARTIAAVAAGVLALLVAGVLVGQGNAGPKAPSKVSASGTAAGAGSTTAPLTSATNTAPGAAPTTRRMQSAAPASVVTSHPTIGRIAIVQSSGALEVDRIVAGAVEHQHVDTATAGAWTAVARIRANKLLLYRSNDGYNKVVTVGDDGAVSIGRTEDAQAGWSHVTGLEDGLVFFYRQSDGFAATLRFGDQDHIRDGDSYLEWRLGNSGYDRVAHAGANRVLLYSSGTGNALLAGIDGDGQIQTITTSRLTAGWTALAATSDGHILGIAGDGTARVLTSSPQGVQTGGSIQLGSGGWLASAPYKRGVALLNPSNGRGLVVELSSRATIISTLAFTTGAGSRAGGLD